MSSLPAGSDGGDGEDKGILPCPEPDLVETEGLHSMIHHPYRPSRRTRPHSILNKSPKTYASTASFFIYMFI